MTRSSTLVNAALVGPKVNTLRLSSLLAPGLRLDAKHYQEEFILAKARVAGCGYPSRNISEVAAAFVPGRTKLVTTNDAGAGAPYLRAHDAFEVRLESDRYIAKSRTTNYESYLLEEGMILTPSSGRNLGPLAYVGKAMTRFAMTDIMRIAPHSPETGYYLFAYLLTPTGQALLRRGRTGTTVDHLAPKDVLLIPIVWPERPVRERLAQVMERAETLIDEARQTLDDLERELHQLAGLTLPLPVAPYHGPSDVRAFSRNAYQLALRVDAAFYDPTVIACDQTLKEKHGDRLDNLARLRLLGRCASWGTPTP